MPGSSEYKLRKQAKEQGIEDYDDDEGGLFSGIAEFSGKVKQFWLVLKKIWSDPESIGTWVKSVVRFNIAAPKQKLLQFFDMIKEKLGAVVNYAPKLLTPIIEAAETVSGWINAADDFVMGLDGWKKALAVMGLALGMSWVWDKGKEIIQDGIKSLLGISGDEEGAEGAEGGEGQQAPVTEGKEEIIAAIKNFAGNIWGNLKAVVIDQIQEKVLGAAKSLVGDAVSGGITKVWEVMKGLFDGAEFILNTLASAVARFSRFKLEEEDF